MTLHADWPDGLPGERYWATFARLGGVLTGQKEQQVRATAERCRNRALRDKSELAEVEAKGVHVECQDFTRQGGATAISVRRR